MESVRKYLQKCKSNIEDKFDLTLVFPIAEAFKISFGIGVGTLSPDWLSRDLVRTVSCFPCSPIMLDISNKAWSPATIIS